MGDQFEVLLTTEDKGQLFNINAWNISNGQSLSVFKGGTSAPNTLCIVNGDYVISSQPNKPVIQVYEMNRKAQQSRKIVVPGVVNCITVSHDGVLLAAGVGNVGQVLVWELNGGELLAVLQRHYQEVTCLAFSTDNSQLISGGKDSIVALWDVINVWDKETISVNGIIEPIHCWTSHVLAVTAVTFGLHNRVYTVSLDRTFKIHDSNSKRTLITLTFDTGILCMALSPTESRVYCGGVNGSIYEVNLQVCNDQSHGRNEVKVHHSVKGHTKQVSCISCSMDSSVVVSGSEDGNVKIWDTGSMQCVRTLGHKGGVTNVRIFPMPVNLLSHWSKPNLPFPQLSRVVASDPGDAEPKYFRIDKWHKSNIEEDNEEVVMQQLIDNCLMDLRQRTGLPEAKIRKLEREKTELEEENKRLCRVTIDKILLNNGTS